MEEQLTEKEKEFLEIMEEAEKLDLFIPNWAPNDVLYKVCYLILKKNTAPKSLSSNQRKTFILDLMSKYVSDIQSYLKKQQNEV